MDKKVARAQPHPFTNTPSAAKFSNPLPSNLNCQYPISANPSSAHQPVFGRSKARGKYYCPAERDYGNHSRNRMVPQQGGRGNHGYQRRTASGAASNEVNRTGGRDGCVASTGCEKSSRHGEDASHLLNFTYTPVSSRGAAEGSSGPRRPEQWRGRSKRQTVQTKQQFLQAHCQFVVKSPVTEVDYVEATSHADQMVEWESIEQVILNDDQIASCPICIDIPVAAKITKCAHIYCWPCILHYLSLTERAWAKCPICFDSIEEKDLKSVLIQASAKYKVGDEITLTLMKRERESLYFRPKSMWKSADVERLFNVSEEEEAARYSKLLSATVSDVEDVVGRERRQLMSRLEQEDTQSLEASFIQAALDSLSLRCESLGGMKTAPVATRELPKTKASDPIPAAVKSDPNLKAVYYADAFEEATSVPADRVAAAGDPAESGPAVEGVSSSDIKAGSLLDQAAGNTEVSDVVTTVKASVRVRTASSTSSCDSGETEQLAANLVLPPTGTQPGHSSGSRRTEVYYFYQAADGQKVYLHSLNSRILAAEYGSLEMAPQTLTAVIVESEDNSMTPELRRRLKYLSHLPLYSQFSVCEVSLRPPVVSSPCLSLFAEELNNRKRMRNRRQRAETKQYNRAQAEERRRMGKHPDMPYHLQSENHFPTSSAPPLSEFTPLQAERTPEPSPLPVVRSAETSQQQEVEHSRQHDMPSRQHEVPLTTPYSFAQAMKGSAGTPAAAVWPRVQSGSNYVKSGGRQSATAAGSDDLATEAGEERAAPSFQDSFNADFEQMLTQAVERKKDSGAENGTNTEQAVKKSKDKRKKKQLVLFSTFGQRATH